MDAETRIAELEQAKLDAQAEFHEREQELYDAHAVRVAPLEQEIARATEERNKVEQQLHEEHTAARLAYSEQIESLSGQITGFRMEIARRSLDQEG